MITAHPVGFETPRHTADPIEIAKITGRLTCPLKIRNANRPSKPARMMSQIISRKRRLILSARTPPGIDMKLAVNSCADPTAPASKANPVFARISSG